VSVKPFFESVFHPDSQLPSHGRVFGKDEWIKLVKNFLAGGMMLQAIKASNEHHILITVALHFKDKDMITSTAKFFFKDGQVFVVNFLGTRQSTRMSLPSK
jgi:hypothetical protein